MRGVRAAVPDIDAHDGLGNSAESTYSLSSRGDARSGVLEQRPDTQSDQQPQAGGDHPRQQQTESSGGVGGKRLGHSLVLITLLAGTGALLVVWIGFLAYATTWLVEEVSLARAHLLRLPLQQQTQAEAFRARSHHCVTA